MSTNILFLSLGSNLGDRRANLESAIGLIGQMAGTVVAVSDFIETQPWGFDSRNAFLNAAVKVETALSPLEALHVTQDIERRLGRTAKSTGVQYQDRTIDIDLLMYFDADCRQVTAGSSELSLPHPLMKKRDFVLIPLRQIAPELKL